MADYGSDFHCVTDIDARLSIVTGPVAVAESICRRLQTPRGGLWYSRHGGTDLRAYINGTPRPREVESATERECEKDERVSSATAQVTMSGSTMRVEILLLLADGPFRLVLEVTAVTVSIVSFNAAA